MVGHRGRIPCGTTCSSTSSWVRCWLFSVVRKLKGWNTFHATGRRFWPVITLPWRTASTFRSWSVGASRSWPSRVLHRQGPRGWLTKWFYSVSGQVPIDRTNADAAQAALDTAQRILGDGKLLGMYPEGTRSPDGRLYKGKSGLARLSLETGVPVIPVAMIGTDVVNPPGSKMWHFGRVTVRFGKPMDFSRFEGWPVTGSSSAPLSTRSCTS